MKRRNTQLSSQCTPACVMTWSAQVSKVSAVRSASRAACHSACRLAFSSATSVDALAQVVFEALEQAGEIREQLGGVDH